MTQTYTEKTAMAVRHAKDLDALLAILNAYAHSDEHHRIHDDGGDPWADQGIDLCSLPTFGGDEPTDTTGIFSWDATRLLVDNQYGFDIIPRD